MNRAYAVFHVKAFDEATRTFEGIATTPSTDRTGDIVDPLGGVYSLPLPMLWQHGKGSIPDPVGMIVAARPSASGITVKGQMLRPGPDYPSTLRDDLNKAWVLIRDGIVRGLSIGFTALQSEPIKGSFGTRYTKWSWLELSAVTIPANAEATIGTIKAASQMHRIVRLPKPGVVRLPGY